MESHYEINVSQRIEANVGKAFGPYHTHLFATAPRSCRSEQEMMAVYKEINRAFPGPKFVVEVTYWGCSGERIMPKVSA